MVRGALSSNSVEQLAIALQYIVNDETVQVVRVKNRLCTPTSSGWADCLVNFVFREDSDRHVCEIQLVHAKLMLVRKQMGAHASYATFRSAAELLEADTRWTEECVLVELFNATNGISWKCKDGWCTRCPMAEWYGVEVNEAGTVTGLRLNCNQLKGTQMDRIRNEE
jgi:hypothetical protein